MKRSSLIPRWGICLCLSAMAISCVSSKKYNELLQKQEDCATENRDLKMAKQDCDASLVESQSLNDRLQADLDNTRTELDTLRRNYILMAADLADLQENYKQIDAEYKSSVSGKDALTEQLSLKETELAEKEKLLNSQSEKLAELQAILDKKDQQINNLRDAVSKALLGFRDKGLSIQMKNGKVYVSMDEKLLFASGSWTVNPQGREAIYELGNVMAQNPDIHIMVEGHTDNVPLRGKGDIKDNWDLSTKRATSIVRLLLENSNIDPSRVSACGRSEYMPLADNDSPENRAKNRRTEIILTPDLDELFQVSGQD